MATPIALQNFLTQSSPQFSSRMTPYDYATTAGSTGLAIGSNARSMRQLEEQLALMEKEYENMLSEQQNNRNLALFQLGTGSPSERKNFINEYSGGLFSNLGTSADVLGTSESGGTTPASLSASFKNLDFARNQSSIYSNPQSPLFGTGQRGWNDIANNIQAQIAAATARPKAKIGKLSYI